MIHSKLHAQQSSLRLGVFFLCNFNGLLMLFCVASFCNLIYYTHAHEDEENQLGIYSQKYILFHRVKNNFTYQEQIPSSAIYFISDMVFLFLKSAVQTFPNQIS